MTQARSIIVPTNDTPYNENQGVTLDTLPYTCLTLPDADVTWQQRL
ncbi:MAG: hypothetical protein ACI9SP_004279 [Arenicella sp.]|jgi:hypothetical protein